MSTWGGGTEDFGRGLLLLFTLWPLLLLKATDHGGTEGIRLGILLVTQITGPGLLTEGENNTKFHTF